MLPDGRIEVTHLWKRFRRERRRRLLRDHLEELASLAGRQRRKWRWALRDVNVTVERGESVALVGSNGSGKTTLLKILTRVMYPNSGRSQVGGRIGALIEVSAGIHPDLTGRENIFLYGTLLGLPRAQVTRRFDEIVAFAELEAAIDRQVKFYSTGMEMRLGFGVAAFLEPDVLLVDEVLAVGDASFQQKCLDRMRDVLAQGTTLLFVSHDLAAVEATCERAVWLEDGAVRADQDARTVLRDYRHAVEAAVQWARHSEVIRLAAIDVEHPDGGPVRTEDPVDLRLVVETNGSLDGSVCLGVSEGTAAPIFLLRRDAHLAAGATEVRCRIPHLPLPRGRYSLWIAVLDREGRELLSWRPVAHFEVFGPDLDQAPRAIARLAPIQLAAGWELARD